MRLDDLEWEDNGMWRIASLRGSGLIAQLVREGDNSLSPYANLVEYTIRLPGHSAYTKTHLDPLLAQCLVYELLK